MAEKNTLMIIRASCWNCNKNMLIALVGTDIDLSYGPEGFSESEKKLVEAHGVLLKQISSKTAGEEYLANVCKECGAFVGQWYYFAHYFTPALYGHLEYKRINL